MSNGVSGRLLGALGDSCDFEASWDSQSGSSFESYTNIYGERGLCIGTETRNAQSELVDRMGFRV